MNEPNIRIIGMIKEFPYEHTRECNQAVYDVQGIAPTILATWQVKSLPAKILVRDGETDTDKRDT